MGRSRWLNQSVNEDQYNRSKRRKTLPNAHGASSASGGTSNRENAIKGEGKVALYHCNYCDKDISSMVRIKCAVCPDFDLCVECFTVGAQITPHSSNHPYRVMENLSFPLITADWNTDEEILLLEGITMYGIGNWNEVAEHVGTKTKWESINHYHSVYMNSPCFPLPDLSHVMCKSKDELLAMNKVHLPPKQEMSYSSDFKLQDGSSCWPQIENDMPINGDAVDQTPSIFNEAHAGPIVCNPVLAIAEKAPKCNKGNNKDSQTEEKNVDLKYKNAVGDEVTVLELNGYNMKRQEFEIEYDNDAEHMLADMEFKRTDSEIERELKLRVLRIYSKRLDERKRRKEFVLERNLLCSDPFEKSLLLDEKEIFQRLKVFMRFLSKDEHEELVRTVIEERRMVKKIQDLQEARAAGCQTSSELNTFMEQKRKKEEEQRLKENIQASKVQKPNHLVVEDNDSAQIGCRETLSPYASNQSATISVDDWDVTGFWGAKLLSESDKQVCNEMRLLPAQFLNIMSTMSQEILRGRITSKVEARGLFKVDACKVDVLYDMLIQRGIAKD